MVVVNKDDITPVYEAVRDDNNDTNWLVLKYTDTEITVDSQGTDYEEFKSKFQDDERAFGYVRLITGDEMSKRAKFALVTWIGKNVKPLQKARVSTDKAFVKEVLRIFALEVSADDVSDITENKIRDAVVKAGGANYGTGN
ncbi:coactosin-like protein [Saccostrea echinata]|uniref:coactosin-like protein n=1 Tax=Saccostrea echinata TaxID=191078 RepID=UPI002A81D360|nr:coactosin-like protein [Saccostrea echinata]